MREEDRDMTARCADVQLPPVFCLGLPFGGPVVEIFELRLRISERGAPLTNRRMVRKRCNRVLLSATRILKIVIRIRRGHELRLC